MSSTKNRLESNNRPESSGFVKLSAEVMLTLVVALTSWGLLVSEESDCIDQPRHNDQLAVCTGENGTILMSRQGGEIVLSRKLVCDAESVVINAPRARAHLNHFDEIIVTYIDPHTLDQHTEVFQIPGFLYPEC